MCPLHEAGCKAKLVRSELASHMAENSQQHLVDMMGAFTELKKQVCSLQSHQQSLVTSMQSIRSEIDYISTKEVQAQTQHLTHLLQMQVSRNISEGLTIFSRRQDSINASQNAAIDCIKTQLMQPPKIMERGDSVAFRMTNYTTWQHGGVWRSPPFYCTDDFEMCLKVNVWQKEISLLLIKGDVYQLPHHFQTLKLQVLDQDLVTYTQQSYQPQRQLSYRSYTQESNTIMSQGQPLRRQFRQEDFEPHHLTSEETARTVKIDTYTDYGTLVANDSIVVQASWPN